MKNLNFFNKKLSLKTRYSIITLLASVLIGFSFTNCSGVGGFYLDDFKSLDLPVNHPSQSLEPSLKIEPSDTRVAPASYVQEILVSLAKNPNPANESQVLLNAKLEALIEDKIGRQRAYFGAPCDFYNKNIGNDCASIDAAKGTYHKAISVQRQTPLLRACEEITDNSPEFLSQAVINLGGNMQAFNEKSVESAILWFYRGRTPDPQLISAMTSSLQGLSAPASWKLLILSVCQSTDWQAI